MENSITERQNLDDNLLLHVVKDRLYLDAQLIWWGGLCASLIVGVGGILVYFTFIPDTTAEKILGIVGGFAGLFLAGRFEKWANKRRRCGARIQEQSDLALFRKPNQNYKRETKDLLPSQEMRYEWELNWNYNLVPEGPLNPDIITDALKRTRKDKNHFMNWYTSKVGETPDIKQQVLLSQRESLSFDYLLRSRFARLCYVVLFVLVVSALILSWYTNPKFQVFLLQNALPFSGLVKFIFDNYQNNVQTAHELEQMEEVVRKKFNMLEADPQKLTLNDLREIQDFIFRNRSTGLPIPDMFYKWLRPKIETTIQSGTKSITKKSEL